MHKKDYELIADGLVEALGDARVIGTPDMVKGVEGAIYALANNLTIHPKFDRQKFLIACGIEVVRERRIQRGKALDEINQAAGTKIK